MATLDNVKVDHLRHFLYLGTHSNILSPKSKYPFDPANALSLDDLVKEGSGIEIVKEIVRFYKDGFFLESDALTYSLAFCAHAKRSDTRAAAFAAAGEICKSAAQMFAFVRFYKDISKPTSGWGYAHRTFLINWYNGKDAKDLASEILKVKSRHKWTHKDILCMAHVKPKDISTAVVLRYILKGMETAEKDFESETEANEVLTYLKVIHQIKHTTDAEVAARLIEIHNLPFELLPTQFFKSKEIWICLIPRLPLNTLLEKLPQLNKFGFLKINSPHLKLLLERLVSEDALSDGLVGPLQTFVALRRLQQPHKRVAGKPFVRTPDLDEALHNLHLSSFKTVPTTEKRYLVALDRRITMAARKCSGCSAVNPSQVSNIILMALVKSELHNVTCVAFSSDGIVPVDVNNKMTLSDIAERLDKIQPSSISPSAPLQWATENKKAFDLIVIFTDVQPEQKDDETVSSLKEYRQTMNLPNSRLILCALSALEFTDSTPVEYGFLKIAGFNMKLLKIIQDFACHVF